MLVLTINVLFPLTRLVGFLLVDKERRERRLQPLLQEYRKGQDAAKSNRLNLWRYGDFTDDDAREFGMSAPARRWWWCRRQWWSPRGVAGVLVMRGSVRVTHWRWERKGERNLNEIVSKCPHYLQPDLWKNPPMCLNQTSMELAETRAYLAHYLSQKLKLIISRGMPCFSA